MKKDETEIVEMRSKWLDAAERSVSRSGLRGGELSLWIAIWVSAQGAMRQSNLWMNDRDLVIGGGDD